MILVDPQDAALLASRSWTDNGRGYFSAKIGGKNRYLHRLIAGATGTDKVDHINGNLDDNRRCNLRLCGWNGSNANRRRKRTSRAPYKGITQTSSGRWLAQIMSNKRHERIGLFDTPEGAAAAYDKRALELHGEYANINFAG